MEPELAHLEMNTYVWVWVWVWMAVSVTETRYSRPHLHLNLVVVNLSSTSSPSIAIGQVSDLPATLTYEVNQIHDGNLDTILTELKKAMLFLDKRGHIPNLMIILQK